MITIQTNVSLKNKCSYRSGGCASHYVEVTNNDELCEALLWAKAREIKYQIIGGGSNLLISDDGFSGLIISTANLNKYIIRNSNSVKCGAGVMLNDLTRFLIGSSLKGFEYLSGIPGTVGGALHMNAGAYGAEIKDKVGRVFVLGDDCIERSVSVQDCLFSYRESKGLSGYIITGALFEMLEGDKSELEIIRKETLEKRKNKQPLDKPSCGSVFKRPSVGFAGEYIEKCGLKGLIKGGAQISEKHANFILNIDNAKSADIKYLIDYIIEHVYQQFSVTLEPEVKLIGF